MKKISILLIMLLAGFIPVSAKKQVCGTITDGVTGDALPGVNILEKGTSNGTVTDMNGQFCLTVGDAGSVLVISYIGYTNEEIEVGNKTEVNLALAEDIVSLQEVVVTGYCVQRKSSVTGAVVSVPGVRIRGVGSGSYRNRKRESQQIQQVNVNQVNYTFDDESYVGEDENSFKHVASAPLSTFSIDVDRAAYSNVRRYLNNGHMPPPEAVRVEEMINYFSYDYPQPVEEHPLAIYTEVADCPWNSAHKLMHVGMQAKDLSKEELPLSNLVFLLDVSGSMGDMNKLPLVKRSLNLLLEELRDEDRVAIVVYAGAAGVVLPSTRGSNKEKIREALNNLSAGGSTAGGQGIRLAYDIAEKNFIKGGNNRVILATDGDFNVGISSEGELEKLISERRKTGIYLTCLGYGMGNYKDSRLEVLADKGNGNYAYIDNIQEAEKTLVEEFSGTMFTIAKDVKIQIEFNPQFVQAYRLVGYENRMLEAEDFNDDSKDAGEVGAGHSVTALYEIIPTGFESEFLKDVDKLKYSRSEASVIGEMATVKVRYKRPDEEESVLFDVAVGSEVTSFESASENLRFASSVAMFGMLLTDSKYLQNVDYGKVVDLAESARTNDDQGYKAEFVRLVKSARSF